jgi:hypothetical protein
LVGEVQSVEQGAAGLVDFALGVLRLGGRYFVLV